jgi:hypothetical protein
VHSTNEPVQFMLWEIERGFLMPLAGFAQESI